MSNPGAVINHFVNELVPEQDFNQHGLQTLCDRHGRLAIELEWTVDRGQGAYLIELRSNPQDPSMRLFGFFWRGQMQEVELRLEVLPSDEQSRHLLWHLMVPSFKPVSPDDASQHQQRMAALKDALRVFRTSGIYSGGKVHVVDFVFPNS